MLQTDLLFYWSFKFCFLWRKENLFLRCFIYTYFSLFFDIHDSDLQVDVYLRAYFWQVGE